MMMMKLTVCETECNTKTMQCDVTLKKSVSMMCDRVCITERQQKPINLAIKTKDCLIDFYRHMTYLTTAANFKLHRGKPVLRPNPMLADQHD